MCQIKDGISKKILTQKNDAFSTNFSREGDIVIAVVANKNALCAKKEGQFCLQTFDWFIVLSCFCQFIFEQKSIFWLDGYM